VSHRLESTQPQLLIEIFLRPFAHEHQNVDDRRQQRSARLYKTNIPTLLAFHPSRSHRQVNTTYLHITEPIKIHIIRKLLLNCPRSRTTRPSPQIITLPILILLPPVHPRRYTPDNQIAQHNDPAESRSHVACYVRFVDAKLVGKYCAEIKND
jgi:hypothetical protein